MARRPRRLPRRAHHLCGPRARCAGDADLRPRHRLPGPPRHSRTHRLPHTPGVCRQSRARIRTAPERRLLCGDRPARRRHPLHGERHARGQRRATAGGITAAARCAARRRRDHRRNQIRLRPHARARTQTTPRGPRTGAGASRECQHHVSRRARAAAGVRRPRRRLHHRNLRRTCCRRWSRKVWSMRSMLSANTSAFRSNRPSASSTPRTSRACA